MRTHYWSCSRFADWLRGKPKPTAETGHGWNLWHKAAQSAHPVRYWIAEEGLDAVQNFIWWPVDFLYSIKYYINNRWVSRTHALTSTSLKPGKWHEFDTRLLHSMFDEMVNYVEIEEAWSNIVWDKAAKEKHKVPFWGSGWFRWRTWRCPAAGIEKLEWASQLTNEEWLPDDQKHLAEPTQQALVARELLELYNWWKNVRPTRPDPHDASGWSAICDRDREEGLDFLDNEHSNEVKRQERYQVLDRCREIEKQYEDEDEQMMIRLIRIRRGLWT